MVSWSRASCCKWSGNKTVSILKDYQNEEMIQPRLFKAHGLLCVDFSAIQILTDAAVSPSSKVALFHCFQPHQTCQTPLHRELVLLACSRVALRQTSKHDFWAASAPDDFQESWCALQMFSKHDSALYMSLDGVQTSLPTISARKGFKGFPRHNFCFQVGLKHTLAFPSACYFVKRARMFFFFNHCRLTV